MTGRERMLKTLAFEPVDRPPTFESLFDLTEEKFGLPWPDVDWEKCSRDDKVRAVDQCVPIYAKIVEAYQWDAMIVWRPWSDPLAVKAVKEAMGDEVLVGTMVGPSGWGFDYISGFHNWETFAVQLHERPHELHEIAEKLTRDVVALTDQLADVGCDFVLLLNDVGCNRGIFIRPEQFAELVTPYTQRQAEHIAGRGMIPMWHSDGNLMSILDQILSFGVKLLHSIDPMAGMDIAEVKPLTYGKMAIMGNVQNSLLQYGPKEAIRESAEYCLTHAAPGSGYVFAESNSVFNGIPLENYEYMLEVFREFCDRQD